MTCYQRQLFPLIAFAALLCGCASHADLTASREVQASGMLGKQLRTTQDLDFLKDRPSNTFRLVTKDYPSYPRNHRLGVVKAGTTLRVDRVVQVTELAGFMFLPFYYTWRCTLARIEDGPYAGNRVAVDGISLDEHTATLRSSLLTADSPRPAATHPQ